MVDGYIDKDYLTTEMTQEENGANLPPAIASVQMWLISQLSAGFSN